MGQYKHNRKLRRAAEKRMEKRMEKVKRLAGNRIPELRERINAQMSDPDYMADPAIREALESASLRLDELASELDR